MEREKKNEKKNEEKKKQLNFIRLVRPLKVKGQRSMHRLLCISGEAIQNKTKKQSLELSIADELSKWRRPVTRNSAKAWSIFA